MSGKAASALMIKLQKMAIDDDLTSDINLDLIKDLYKEVVDGNNLDVELQIPEIMKLERTLEEFKLRQKLNHERLNYGYNILTM